MWTIEARQSDISNIAGPLTLPKEKPEENDVKVRLDPSAIDDLIIVLHYAGKKDS